MEDGQCFWGLEGFPRIKVLSSMAGGFVGNNQWPWLFLSMNDWSCVQKWCHQHCFMVILKKNGPIFFNIKNLKIQINNMLNFMVGEVIMVTNHMG